MPCSRSRRSRSSISARSAAPVLEIPNAERLGPASAASTRGSPAPIAFRRAAAASASPSRLEVASDAESPRSTASPELSATRLSGLGSDEHRCSRHRGWMWAADAGRRALRRTDEALTMSNMGRRWDDPVLLTALGACARPAPPCWVLGTHPGLARSPKKGAPSGRGRRVRRTTVVQTPSLPRYPPSSQV